MKTYLKSVSQQLRNYNQSLDNLAILIEKPWAMIDGENEMQKLIFKKNKELILSRNGQVTMGSWDYFPEAKSLLIDRGTDRILCNEAFVDEAVMVLKMDGTSNNFFVMANENRVPNLDAISYLQALRAKRLNLKKARLNDGSYVEISFIIGGSETNTLTEGLKVFQDDDFARDGLYFREKSVFKVAQGRIVRLRKRRYYQSKCGRILEIHQKFEAYYRGDDVFIDGNLAPDGDYKLGWLKKIKVISGKIA